MSSTMSVLARVRVLPGRVRALARAVAAPGLSPAAVQSFVLLFLLSLAILIPAPPALAQAGWISFTPPEATFNVLMPSRPGRSVQNGTDNGVSFTQQRYLVQTPSLIELATVADYAEGPYRPTAEAVRDAMLKSLRVKLTSSTSLPFVRSANDILPGLSFTAENPAQACKANIFVDRRRVLALLFCAKAGVNHAADIERALASFKVLQRPLSQRH
jgi:hypothetical protein